MPHVPADHHLAPHRHDNWITCATSRGFTLIELMVVVALIAIASGAIAITLGDASDRQLQQEAERLAFLVESARADARAEGESAMWVPKPPGQAGPDFRFLGTAWSEPMPEYWLNPDVRAEVRGAPAVALGPEPYIGAQRIVLSLGRHQRTIATDGLGPFALMPDETPP